MSIIRIAAAALTLALAATSVNALAAPSKGPRAKDATEEAARHEHQAFPLQADKFQALIEKRITHASEKLDGMLVKHKVPEATRAQVKKDFEDGVALVRAAAKRVEADGKVTKEEAKEVRDLAKSLKQKMHEKYAPHAGKKPSKRA